jgi:subtilisin-like proprotein convertase family protein
MKIFSIVLVAALLAVAPARGQTNLSATTGNQTIPEDNQTNFFAATANQIIADDNPTGLGSIINVSGVAGLITGVTVNLNISGGYNGDLYCYLSYGDALVVLLNRVGKTSSDPFGYSDAGFNITLDDAGAADIHSYGGNNGDLLTGVWQPDGRAVDPQNVMDTDARTTSLSLFDNKTPNGQWELFVADMAGGEGTTSTLVSWSLSIVTAPEPGSLALLVCGGLASLIFCLRRNYHRRAARQD